MHVIVMCAVMVLPGTYTYGLTVAQHLRQHQRDEESRRGVDQSVLTLSKKPPMDAGLLRFLDEEAGQRPRAHVSHYEEWVEQIVQGNHKYSIDTNCYRHMKDWHRRFKAHLRQLQRKMCTQADHELKQRPDPIATFLLNEQKDREAAMQALMDATPLPRVLLELIIDENRVDGGLQLLQAAQDSIDIRGAQNSNNLSDYWGPHILRLTIQYWFTVDPTVTCTHGDILTADYCNAQRYQNLYFRLDPITPPEVARFRLLGSWKRPPRWVSWFYDGQCNLRSESAQPPHYEWGYFKRC